jgi:hypothetical protein
MAGFEGTGGLIWLAMMGGMVLGGCSRGDSVVEEPAPQSAPGGETETVATKWAPRSVLLMVQAQFKIRAGKPAPGPAKLTLWSERDGVWGHEVIEDPDSSVFHKAVVFESGILTIAQGMPGTEPQKPAKLSHWNRVDGVWEEEVLWSRVWDGRFQRIRDMEFGDFDQDGDLEIAMATHDMGVVAVADRVEGTWVVHEMDEKPDTFVHEVEVGDVDGDGRAEFYATPSDRNKSSGASQPGGVVRYDLKDGAYVQSEVVMFTESHAKEILVADMDQQGPDELYVVKEGHVVKEGDNTRLVDPVTVVRMVPDGANWTQVEVARLEGDPQCRFIFPADPDHDGTMDLVAAGKETGLWWLRQQADGSFKPELIDAGSGGFEHAAHAADLDGDGKQELYVAADTQKKFRRYVWNGTSWDRTVIADIPSLHITWNLQDGVLDMRP